MTCTTSSHKPHHSVDHRLSGLGGRVCGRQAGARCCSALQEGIHTQAHIDNIQSHQLQAVRAWEDEYAAAREERAAALRLAANEQFAAAAGDAEADAAAGMFSIDDMGAAGAAAPPCSQRQAFARSFLRASGCQGPEHTGAGRPGGSGFSGQ
jgi:hypothetical protein